MYTKQCSCGLTIELDGQGYTNDNTTYLDTNEMGVWYDCSCGTTGLFIGGSHE